jgi:NAD(P)-dependent dehydrogenase (short-subunit alcohol dehydrogenase family)
MAREGAAVVIFSPVMEELHETKRIISEDGGQCMAVKADVSHAGDVQHVAEKTLSRFGRIDILMNNAGIVGPVALLYKVKEREWDRTVDINLKGAYLCSKSVVPQMISQKNGKIINVTSGLGNMVMSPFGVYSITKSGLIHMTRFLAAELKTHNIQVNGLDPGVVDTGMQEEIRSLGPEILGKKVFSEFLSMKNERRLSPPERPARLAVFLASPASDSLSGEIGTEQHYRKFGFKETHSE